MATNNNNVFVLDDGTKEITFQNKYGEEICKLHIRGGDLSIIDRYNELMNDFEKIMEPLSGIELANDGTTAFEENWKTVKKVEHDIIDRLNKIFDTNEAGNFFASRNAFSTINGHFYVENVINALGQVVANEMAHETAMAKKRIDKYMKDVAK